MRRLQYLSALSLGILLLALIACQRGEAERGSEVPKFVEGRGGRQALAPRLTSGSPGTLGDLERAARQSPQDARILNDLGAAYLLRAYREDHPVDLVRALATTARAHAADPSLPEARFNHALNLERLYLSRVAVEAWKDYL